MTTTIIRGFTCEIEPNEDREGVNCYVSKDRYSASLAWLEGEGYLYHDVHAGELPVHEGITDLIRQWAETHGY